MESIKNKILEIKENIIKIENNEYSELFNSIISLVEDFSEKIDEVIVKQQYLEENVQYMDEDLTDLQEELFEEVSFDELNDFEDEYVEIECTNCKKPLFVEKESIDSNKIIPCPFCKGNAR